MSGCTFSTKTTGYMCKFCELFGSTSSTDKAFAIRGVKLKTHPSRALNRHQNSTMHKMAMQRYVQSRSNVNVYRQVLLAEISQTNENRDVMKKVFSCIDFMIKNQWAVTEKLENL